jgi:hypothetical protein
MCYSRRVEGIIFAIKLRFAFQTSEFHMHRFLTHYQYFSINAETAADCN